MARRIVAEFDAVTGPFLQKLNRIDSSINRFERGTLNSFNRVERGVNTLVGTASRLRTLTGLFATGFGVNLGTQFLDQAKLIRNALREAGDESQETFEKVFRSSVRALAGFRDTAQGVQRFQKALGDRQGIDQSIRQLETLNKLLALAGKTTQERQSTFIQFSQALQAGYLGGEELRSVRENAPIELTREIARVAGGTIEDLKDLSAEGKLTTDVLVQALKNLEEEADKRFGAIQVTIQDAATVLASGATIAAEGFDKGLGISRATVASLKVLGTALGENGEAFERFGEAVKIAGGLLITSFAGRRITSVVGGLKDLSRARVAAAAAAETEFAAAQKAARAAQDNLAVRSQTLASLTAQGAAVSKVAAAQKAQTNAVRRLQAAQGRLRTAYASVTAAQNALLLSNRALAASVTLLRGAFNFLGGVPGLILTGATAFLLIRDRIADAAERQKELLNVTRDYASALDDLTERRRDLKNLLDNLGEDNLDGASSVVNQLKGEITRLENSLKSARREARSAQNERLNLLEEEQRKLDRLKEARKFLDEQLKMPLDSFQRFAPSGQPGQQGAPLFTEQELRQRRSEALRGLQEQALLADRLIAEQEAAVQAVQDAIDAARDSLLELSGAIIEKSPDAAASTREIEEAFRAAQAAIEDNKSEIEEMEDEIKRLEGIYSTLQSATGDTSTISQKLARIIADLKEELRLAKLEANGFTDELEDLKSALDDINTGNVDITAELNSVRRQIAAAKAGASEARVEAIGDVAAIDENYDDLRAAGISAGEIEALRNRSIQLRVSLAEAKAELKGILDPEEAKGGKSSGVTNLERAKDIIESMMTDTERQTQAIREAEKLRDRLAKGTEQEKAAVDALNEAIARMKTELELARNETDLFFDSMAQNLANAITDWTNFGDVVRGILADLVREYGPDFFKAILTPGQQAAGEGDFGTRLGNILTGPFHDGGRSGRRRSVSPLAFVGAPRFHKGLMPDEFPAILQKGEAVIPKGLVGRMGQGATFVFNNDFRNADPSMKPWIEAQLARQRAEFESRWVKTARKVNMNRMKLS